MKAKLFIIFISILLMFGCEAAQDASDDIVGDDDEVVIIQDKDDDDDKKEEEEEEEEVVVIIDPSSDIPIEIPANELLSNINLTGVTALAIKPRAIQLSWIDKALSFIGIQTAIAAGECDELGTIDVTLSSGTMGLFMLNIFFTIKANPRH